MVFLQPSLFGIHRDGVHTLSPEPADGNGDLNSTAVVTADCLHNDQATDKTQNFWLGVEGGRAVEERSLQHRRVIF